MKSRRVLRYLCDHCNKGFWNKKKCLRHEPMCLRNPRRICEKCKELGVEQRPLDYFFEDIESWYGDVDELRKMANGCPLCMLAAKMDADAYVAYYDKWTDFDYKAEVDRIEKDKYPDGMPF